MSISLSAFDPRYSIHLGGFDRRGCAASLNNVSQTGFIVSGYFSDLPDFVTLYLFDSDDLYGHLYTSRFLPIFDLTGVVVDFDLALTNCFSPISTKYPSIFQGSLQYMLSNGTPGNVPLVLSSPTGGTAASCTYTINVSSPAAGDECLLVYMGNVQFDVIWGGVYNSVTISTAAQAATEFARQINLNSTGGGSFQALTATASGATFTVTHSSTSIDGNSVELQELHKNSDFYITPGPTSKLTGGVDPTSIHVKIDFSTLGITSIRQAWLTIGPPQPYDSGSTNPAQVPFSSLEFSYIVSNISLTDPNSKCPLSVAGPGSVVVDSNDVWSAFVGSWGIEAGSYSKGYAKASSTIGDTVTVNYSCGSVHDLYLGTALYVDRGKFSVTIDGTSISAFDCYLPNLLEQLVCRRLLANGLTSGTHTIVLTVANKNGVSSGNTVYFDFLHAVIASNPTSPVVTYPTVSAALDFDTDQTYKIPAARNIYYLQQVGLLGDIDFYAGVFFALKRRRRGGFFHASTVTLGGSVVLGDSYFLNIGGTSLGVGVTAYDTLTTLAQRMVNAINASFVGVWAASVVGVITITSLSPINGFTIAVTPGTSLTVTLAGDINAGNEGIWEVDPTQTSPLNKAFSDYLADFSALCVANSFTFTVAFSQELLAPPDVNTSAGAWIQRFLDGNTVLTSTGFGSWGSGYVESVSSGIIQQTGHGYISGYFVAFNGVGAYQVTVVDSNHYTVTPSFSPTVGAQVLAQLQTSQCNFNPSTVTAYLTLCYVQAAGICSAAGVTEPWLQFGEMGWWFFPGSGPLDTQGMAYYDAYTSAAALALLGRTLAVFTGPNDSPAINSFADANFLVSNVKTHIHTIRVAVLVAISSCKFSWLWPSDVNWDTAFSDMIIDPIGGQLNRYVNTPSDYQSPGSDIDRIDGEALAWGTTYFTIDNAKVSMLIPTVSPWTWTAGTIKYLVPWDGGGNPWQEEFYQSQQVKIGQVVMWAFDHIILFSWKLPFPTVTSSSE
jgi:hypothetical protein